MNSNDQAVPREAYLFPEWRSKLVGSALGVFLIFVLVFCVYSPILPGSFLMDDHRLVKEDNALLNGQLTPATIWFQTDFTLTAIAWWLQWLAWGDHPLGYHVVNIVLHGLSAVLLWLVLRQLKIRGSWFIAATFAVHPVCVNSVARIAELKNTLSVPFFLLSLWAYLCYEKSLSKTVETSKAGFLERGFWYGLAFIAFVLALLSKTSTVMLPVILLACAAWQRRKIATLDWVQTIPFLILSIAFGLMSVWFQKHQALADAGQTLVPETLGQRIAIAGHVVCFYLGKALLPFQLNIIYPKWKLDSTALTSFLPAIFLAILLIVSWRFRRSWGSGVLFGLGCFVVMLFPVLGFFDSQFLVKWQVSDHLQYLPLLAPVTLIVGGWTALVNRRLYIGPAILLIFVLALLSFQRAQAFASEEKLLRDTLTKNPDAADAHNDLGVILAQRHNYAEATTQFSTAVDLDPENAGAQLNLGRALALTHNFDEAARHLKAAIQLRPTDPAPHAQYANLLLQTGGSHEAEIQLAVAQSLSPKPNLNTGLSLATIFYHTGDYLRAVAQYHKMLASYPDDPDVLSNLAWLLATCPDASVRNGPDAVKYAEKACELTAYQKTRMMSTLGAAYAEAGRFPEAVSITERAIQMQTANVEMQFAAASKQLLKLYQWGIPYHENPAGQ